jgi:hypothetical protein
VRIHRALPGGLVVPMAAAEGQGRMTDDGGWGSYASPVQFANSIEQARELMADGGDHLDASTLAINAKYAALNQEHGAIITCDDGHSRATKSRQSRQSASVDETCYQLPYSDPVGLWFSRVMLLALAVLIVFILAVTGVLG